MDEASNGGDELRTNAKPTRRRVLATLGTVGIAGVAGCSGGSNDGSGGNDGGNGGDSGDGSNGGNGSGSNSGSGSCDLSLKYTNKDTAGTPYLFTYDAPEGWTGRPVKTGSDSIYQTTFSSQATTDSGVPLIGLTVGQKGTIDKTANFSPPKDEPPEYPNENYEKAFEITFDGEQLPVGVRVEDSTSFAVNYSTHLPGSVDGEKKYFDVSVVANMTQTTDLECEETLRDLGKRVLKSFEPNPDVKPPGFGG